MKVEVIQQSVEIGTPKEVYKNFVSFIEGVGRVCYKSEDRITKDSAEKFVRQIIKSGHESVLEHANLTVKFITDRGMTHSLVRHRHCAFSQESTHFINYKKKDTLQVVEQKGIDSNDDKAIWNSFMDNMGNDYSLMDSTKCFSTRSIFPTAIKTELIMTTNLREWRHILKIRTAPTCHPQMKELMGMLLNWFKTELPIFVEDIDA